MSKSITDKILAIPVGDTLKMPKASPSSVRTLVHRINAAKTKGYFRTKAMIRGILIERIA